MNLLDNQLQDKTKFQLSYYRLLAIVVTAGIIAAIIASVVVTTIVDNKFETELAAKSQEFDNRLNTLLSDSCNNSSNVDAAYRILAGDFINVDRPTEPTGKVADFPNFDYLSSQIYNIVDCEKTLAGDKVVYLTKTQERRYIEVVADGRLPVVENGVVVGSTQFRPNSPEAK